MMQVGNYQIWFELLYLRKFLHQTCEILSIFELIFNINWTQANASKNQ
jgi:hypothetical protein